MDTPKIVTLIIGIIMVFLSIAAFFNPNWARWINIPGGVRLRSIVAFIIGLILIYLGLFIQFQTN